MFKFDHSVGRETTYGPPLHCSWEPKVMIILYNKVTLVFNVILGKSIVLFCPFRKSLSGPSAEEFQYEHILNGPP